MNSLQYLLEKIVSGDKITIMYNGDHCFGVNSESIFDYNGLFKSEILSGKSVLEYYEISSHYDIRVLTKIFKLNASELKVLVKYYNNKRK